MFPGWRSRVKPRTSAPDVPRGTWHRASRWQQDTPTVPEAGQDHPARESCRTLQGRSGSPDVTVLGPCPLPAPVPRLRPDSRMRGQGLRLGPPSEGVDVKPAGTGRRTRAHGLCGPAPALSRSLRSTIRLFGRRTTVVRVATRVTPAPVPRTDGCPAVDHRHVRPNGEDHPDVDPPLSRSVPDSAVAGSSAIPSDGPVVRDACPAALIICTRASTLGRVACGALSCDGPTHLGAPGVLARLCGRRAGVLLPLSRTPA
jgi:hypothetical protein